MNKLAKHISCNTLRSTVALSILILVSVAFFAVVSIVANAQDTAPTSPINIISPSEFNQMVEAGQLEVSSPKVLLEQDLQTLLTDLENQFVVDEFMYENPNLPGFAKLVSVAPAPPMVSGVWPTLDGNYRMAFTNSNGVSQSIETMGQGEKLAALADSIQTSANPAKQLLLYHSLFSEYNAWYTQFCSTPTTADVALPPGCLSLLPSGAPNPTALPNPSTLLQPSALVGASLEEIQSALQSFVFQYNVIVPQVPTPPPPAVFPVPCNVEMIGASLVASGVNNFYSFGDQTQSSGYTTPYAAGIVSNFNFPSKNLISCIKNQGQRGTCHIFTATSAVEELIARDTGVFVNLSEQDFMENLKLLWTPNYYSDSGWPGPDLQTAAAQNYQFAYENQWDYNPSLSQPKAPVYEYQNSCQNYPYPFDEPGCSDSAPQAPEYFDGLFFGFSPVTVLLSSPRSPYSANALGVVNVWNPLNPGLSLDYIYLALAFNNAVTLGFNETNNFQNGSPGGYITYSAADNNTSLGLHAVHVVGFVGDSALAANAAYTGTKNPAGGGYFIIKNSWGASFGDAGFVYMPVDYFVANAVGVWVVSGVND